VGSLSVRVQNIDQALNLALKYEAFKMSRNRKFTNSQYLRDQQEIHDNSFQDLYEIGENCQTIGSRSDPSKQRNETKKCFYCGEPDHFQNKCRKLQFNLKFGKLNISAHKINDSANLTERPETSEQLRDCARDSLNGQRLSL
jgi:hypothetical protein